MVGGDESHQAQCDALPWMDSSARHDHETSATDRTLTLERLADITAETRTRPPFEYTGPTSPVGGDCSLSWSPDTTRSDTQVVSASPGGEDLGRMADGAINFEQVVAKMHQYVSELPISQPRPGA